MPAKTPNHAVIHGRVDRDGYTVEKVYFQSYPGHFVTGSLYRPKGRTGRLPAVLAPHGHWANGRFFDAGAKEIRWQLVRGEERFEVGGRYILQALCVQLARMGCVVFQYDMVGVADSRQTAALARVAAEARYARSLGIGQPAGRSLAGNQLRAANLQFDPRVGFRLRPARRRSRPHRHHRRQRRRHADVHPLRHRSPPGGRLSRRDGLDRNAGRLQLRKRPLSADRHGQRRVRRAVRPQAAGHDRRRRLDARHGHQRLSRTQAALQTPRRRRQRHAQADAAIRPQLQLRQPGGDLLVVQQASEAGPDRSDRGRGFSPAFDRRAERLGQAASRPAGRLRPPAGVPARSDRIDAAADRIAHAQGRAIAGRVSPHRGRGGAGDDRPRIARGRVAGSRRLHHAGSRPVQAHEVPASAIRPSGKSCPWCG